MFEYTIRAADGDVRKYLAKDADAALLMFAKDMGARNLSELGLKSSDFVWDPARRTPHNFRISARKPSAATVATEKFKK